MCFHVPCPHVPETYWNIALYPISKSNNLVSKFLHQIHLMTFNEKSIHTCNIIWHSMTKLNINDHKSSIHGRKYKKRSKPIARLKCSSLLGLLLPGTATVLHHQQQHHNYNYLSVSSKMLNDTPTYPLLQFCTRLINLCSHIYFSISSKSSQSSLSSTTLKRPLNSANKRNCHLTMNILAIVCLNPSFTSRSSIGGTTPGLSTYHLGLKTCASMWSVFMLFHLR